VEFQGLLLQILLGFVFLVFFVASGAGIYLVVLSEVKGLAPNTRKMRVLWAWGMIVLFASIGAVVVIAALALGRAASG